MSSSTSLSYRTSTIVLTVSLGLALPALDPRSASAQLTDLGAQQLHVCILSGDCEPNDNEGWALAVGDFNGDGFDDLAVSLPGATVGGHAQAGSIHVYYGSPAGLRTSGAQAFSEDTPGVAGGSQDSANFGFSLAAADFNFDGFADLAIGEPGEGIGTHPGAGFVVILWGSASGLTASGSIGFSQNTLPGGSSESAEDQDGFGWTLAAYHDSIQAILAVGVPNEDLIPVFQNNAGEVDLLLGDPNFGPFNNNLIFTQGSGAQPASCSTGGGDQLNGFFGVSLAFGRFGNVESPGLAVGASGDSLGIGVSTGRFLEQFFGVVDNCWDQNTSGILGTAEAGDAFAGALAAGDFNGDGYSDVASGVPGEDLENLGLTDAGEVAIINGSPSGLTATGNQLFDQNLFGSFVAASGNEFGSALAAGDFDGDGIDDLAIGVPFASVDGNSLAGLVNVAYGSPGGITSNGVQTFDQNSPPGMPDASEPGDTFGSTLAVGDFDGNGVKDLAIGVPGESFTGETQTGTVDVIYGLDRSIGAFGTVQFIGAAQSVFEPPNSIVVHIPVHRSGSAVVAASVHYAVTGGTATLGLDYTFTPGTLNWAAGDLADKTFPVTILHDHQNEGNKSIDFGLSSPSNGIVIGSQSTHIVIIIDEIFLDGFEAGDTHRWSLTVP